MAAPIATVAAVCLLLARMVRCKKGAHLMSEKKRGSLWRARTRGCLVANVATHACARLSIIAPGPLLFVFRFFLGGSRSGRRFPWSAAAFLLGHSRQEGARRQSIARGMTWASTPHSQGAWARAHPDTATATAPDKGLYRNKKEKRQQKGKRRIVFGFPKKCFFFFT
ncbi:hypothetical protein TW95_gp1495 [Pandoravirus inopinatum]|uniref:Uncharacterized protein n=1 Tax=Pandoravirus inopinatum TaxID=1605721 RepID=A0A0B5J3R8_9VIRU|nr:hypothetical protein TW95_gp1495 [Pandoravirus inopinatum]AJF98229.1 hypothetical protein [Pandoravirus inopinatum]